MPVTDLHCAQPAQDPIGRRDPETGSEEVAGESGEGIIAGIISVRLCVLFVWSEVFNGRLCIIPVEGGDGEERSDLDGYFEAGCMAVKTPVVGIEAVIRPQDDPVPEEVVQPESQRELEPVGGQLLYRIGPVCKKYPVERQAQVSLLFDQVEQNGSLQTGIDDL